MKRTPNRTGETLLNGAYKKAGGGGRKSAAP